MKRGTAVLIVSALVIVQGQGAESAGAKWENEIRAFEAGDRANPPPRDAVLFVGSSSIRLWTNLAGAFPELTIIRRGFGGSRIEDATAFAERIILPYRPAKILLYAGDNDIAQGLSPETVLANFKSFVAKIRETLPRAEIYFLSIKPSPARWHLSPQAREANRLVRRYCARSARLRFIDLWTPMLTPAGQPDPSLFAPDRLHLNGKGYELWARIIRKQLKG